MIRQGIIVILSVLGLVSLGVLLRVKLSSDPLLLWREGSIGNSAFTASLLQDRIAIVCEWSKNPAFAPGMRQFNRKHMQRYVDDLRRDSRARAQDSQGPPVDCGLRRSMASIPRIWGPTPIPYVHSHVVVRMWLLSAVFFTYPTIAFIRGPYRRHRRRRKGLCPTCGYDLAGNVSGVCPECGTIVGESS